MSTQDTSGRRYFMDWQDAAFAAFAAFACGLVILWLFVLPRMGLG